MGTFVSNSLLEAREGKSDPDTPRDKGGQVTGNCGNCGKPDITWSRGVIDDVETHSGKVEEGKGVTGNW